MKMKPKTKNKPEHPLQKKMLTKEQGETVKSMIVASMRGVYTGMGILPGVDFDHASGAIAEKILSDTQKALMQENVFIKAVKNSKPLKKNGRK